jgi:hypothetical protein
MRTGFGSCAAGALAIGPLGVLGVGHGGWSLIQLWVLFVIVVDVERERVGLVSIRGKMPFMSKKIEKVGASKN